MLRTTGVLVMPMSRMARLLHALPPAAGALGGRQRAAHLECMCAHQAAAGMQSASNGRCPTRCPPPLQYGSAKDVVNIAGMVASNVVRGDHPIAHWADHDWEAIAAGPDTAVIDVREPGELKAVSWLLVCSTVIQLI